jgi:hypothetical protein
MLLTTKEKRKNPVLRSLASREDSRLLSDSSKVLPPAEVRVVRYFPSGVVMVTHRSFALVVAVVGG